MKNKGVMISLAAILAIGILITKGTRHFIENNRSGYGIVTQMAEDGAAGAAGAAEAAGELKEESFASEASAEQENSANSQRIRELDEKYAETPDSPPHLSDGAGPDEAGAVFAGGGGSPDEADAGLIERGGTEEKEKEDLDDVEEPISPLDTVPAEETDNTSTLIQEIPEKEAALTESQSYYKKRLMDLDIQIQRTRESQEGSGPNSSVRSSASSELKLWDSELNSIYNAILECLDKERSELLVEQQRTWMKERDSLAMAAAKNSSGGSSESTEYTASLAESTRRRAYQLVEEYGAELEEQGGF